MITNELIGKVRGQAFAMAARAPRGVGDRDELFSVGEHALVLAAERWDASRGSNFDLYALQRTRGAMVDYLRSIDPTPRDVRKAMRKASRESSSVDQRTQARHHTLVRLDSPDVVEGFLDSSLRSNGLGAPEHATFDPTLLVPALLTLDPMAQFIVWQSRAAGAQLALIGSFLGVTAQRAHQIEKAALVKLRHSFVRLNTSQQP